MIRAAPRRFTRLNVLVGDGNFHILSATRIAHGYLHRTDPVALVVGPTGLAFNPFAGLLYVASTGDNAIFAIPFAGFTNKTRAQACWSVATRRTCFSRRSPH
jgi:DNA-binding beta-propeller fold protein YncE